MELGLASSAVVAFAAAAFCCWWLAPIAGRIGLVDHPCTRKRHHRPTPLVGGIAMFIAFILAVLSLDVGLAAFRPLFAAALILVVIGAVDDLQGLSAGVRFAAQIAAALIMVTWGGVLLRDLGEISFSGGPLGLGILAVPFTVFATVGVINATNMVDGLDGLAGSLTLVTVGALVLAATTAGAWPSLGILLVLASVILAFLIYNLRPRGPALVFMGDAGSMFLGLVVAWFLIDFSQGANRLIAPTTALWLFALPLIDTVYVMSRRLAQRRSPFSADRTHCHHVLLDVGFSRRQTLLIMVTMAVIAAAIGLVGDWNHLPDGVMLVAFLLLSWAYVWLMGLTFRQTGPLFALQPILQGEARSA